MEKSDEQLEVQKERKRKNNEYIKSMGIACLESLPLIESSCDVELKDLDTICKRAIACLLSTQLACDIMEKHDFEESKELYTRFLKKFGVENELLKDEKKLFENKYDDKDVLNVSWTYECYWSLVWALGLIEDEDIMIPDRLCDCDKAVLLVSECKNFEEFKSKTKIRDIEDILDMLDLFYRYHWACEEKRINPDTNIGSLNPEVVWERRKGLEWLISKLTDWEDISLDT